MTASTPQDALLTASKRLLRYRIPLAIALLANCIMIARVPLRGMLASDIQLQDVTRRQPIEPSSAIEPSPVPPAESQADSAMQPATATSRLSTNHNHPEVHLSLPDQLAKPAVTPTLPKPTKDLPSGNVRARKTTVVQNLAGPSPRSAPQLGPATSPPVDRIKSTKTAETLDMGDIAKHMRQVLRKSVADFQERVARKTTQWADPPVAIVAQLPTWLPLEPKQPTASKQQKTATLHNKTLVNTPPKLPTGKPKPDRTHTSSTNVQTKQIIASSPHKTESRWSVRNPTENRAKVSFLVDGKVYSLAPGQSRTFSTTKEQTVRFHRGADFGAANQKVRQGPFNFRVTDTGWHLVPAKVAVHDENSD